MAKTLSLRPYVGEVVLCRDLKELAKLYKKFTGNKYPYQDEKDGGRYVVIEGDQKSAVTYLVYARKPHVLAHEFTHCLLNLFERIGAEPQCGNGEPFCYMLSQLMLESK